ncbi:hypothetical protein V7S43_011736 [Phytophthora oleae]|uniref:BZIP domain-containing protein n=1 Tax=Phytophthora oleae TaxID=2107226 RepID=A0ABD3F8Z5_9STRA
MGDRVMMEVVLELLAADSPDQARTESATSASGSNHTSSASELNHGSIIGNNHGNSGNETGSGVQGAIGPRKDDSLEEKYLADHRTVQFQGAEQQNSMTDSPTPVALAVPRSLQSPWSSPLVHHPAPFFAATVTLPPPSAELVASVPIPSVASIGSQLPRKRASPPEQQRPSSISTVLPTGQRVKVMNSAEFDELRRKLRMQTASRRYQKRKKV